MFDGNVLCLSVPRPPKTHSTPHLSVISGMEIGGSYDDNGNESFGIRVDMLQGEICKWQGLKGVGICSGGSEKLEVCHIEFG